MMRSDKNHLYRFDDYQLDAAERVLKRSGEIVPLPLKPFEVLLVLVERHGSVVSKEELMKQVWPNSFVEEANLARHIYMLRQTLGESIKAKGGKHHYIQTIPGRGYRFACEVETCYIATELEEQGLFKDNETTAECDDPSHLSATQPVEEGEVTSNHVALTVSQAQPHRSWRLPAYHPLFLALTITTLILLSVFLIITRSRIDESPPEPTITRLTNNGNVLVSLTSPDGKYIVSIVEEKGKQSVWVKLSSNGSDRQIAPPSSFKLGDLACSPDSSFVYYNATTKQDRVSKTLYQVPIIGGTVRKIREGIDSPVSFAPDGIHFAFVREDPARGRSSLLIGSLNDEAERELIARETPEYLGYTAWSPDGGRIVCTFHTASGGFQSRLLEVSSAGGNERLIPIPSWRYIRKPIWLKDGSGLVVTVTEKFLFSNAWFLPFSSDHEPTPRRLTNGIRQLSGVSITDDMRELVFTEKSRYANVWVASSADASRATKITSGGGHYEDLIWTPDGRLLYVSDANGFWNIWVMNADGSGKRQLTFDAYDKCSPSMSPDGRYIFFTSYRNGGSTIWRTDADGSNPKQLTFGGNEIGPCCAPDGQWVIFTSYSTETAFALRKVSVEGGEPATLSRGDVSVSDGVPSPDGRYVACMLTEGRSSPSVQPTKLAVISLTDGAIRKLGAIALQRVNGGNVQLRWTPDSGGVVYADSGDDECNLWVQPLAGGPPRRLTDFRDDQIFGFDFARDGRLAALRGVVKNEIVRISNPNLRPGTTRSQ
jgi:Tol biopolymer transport system component/DNA-binding winged helix-turn-helix (wHTH) protein